MAVLFSLILLTVVSVLAAWLYWRRRCWWEARIPRYLIRTGPTFPLIGNVYQLLGGQYGTITNALDIIHKLKINESLRPVYFWVGEAPCSIIFRAEDLEVLLGSSKETFKLDRIYETAKLFFGAGLITINGESWKRHRKILTPVFHFKILEKYVDVFKNRAQILTKDLLTNPKYTGIELDVVPIMARTVSHTICETAFGMSEKLASREEIQKKEEFLSATETAFGIIKDRILRPWLMVSVLFRMSSYYALQKKAEDTINEYALRIIRMKKEEIAQEDYVQLVEDDCGAKKKVAFLDLVLRESKNLLSEDEILQEVRTLVTVQQTTATTISFILVMLAIHQDVQEKVYQEIQELDARTDDRPTYERLGELKYLERVIKETMRLYPVTPIFGRLLKEELAFNDFSLPEGIGVGIFLYTTHRDKRFYGPNPDRFDPDHFLPERCRDRHPYAYVPFSAGPRNCIGQKYAMLQMKAIVSSVVRSLRLFPGKGCRSQEEILLDIDTFLHIKGGFNVRFEPRV